MPNQEITVGLRFTADTAAARQQLNTLKQDLNNLGTLNNINFGSGLSKSILEASSAAAKLKVQLEEATNIKTGNLDLTKFSFNLKQSGMTLEQYKKQLFALGSGGEKAFFQLANSIQQAEIPMLRINKLAANLWDSLKRTAKWQISSSAIHAVMGAVQSAYGYAKDLNESLNNIRIVTGQSSEQMAKFAQNANKTAKALSTTTTAYTDAALIYYQQGLSDQEVLARTDTTIKMANVTRQSAETVSDQMTAVWNNFAKGNENLESFADKMVALGAATASSSDEIAQGLEKFAGVADTIGLSFDYAAAALTTITATTRMSADTVGTALKTLFSRLESLKLGDSLEDGTDLTKYSEALAKVGVNIKDANGEIKKMDAILDETMAKWQTLDKASQIALAQTVAGQRQYTHFMTLMSQSDFFKENLRTQANSMGALQEQADIYAESWEAADKKVKASMEAIYQDILNDDFFIKLTSGFADVLEKVDQFIKALGGLQGILPGIAALILKIGGDKIALNLERSAHGLKNLITQGSDARKLQAEAGNISFKELESSDSLIDQSRAAMYEAINKSQYALNTNAKKLSDIDLKHFQILLDKVRVMHEIATEKAKESEDADKIVESDKKSLKNLIEREKRIRNQGKQQYIDEQKINIEKQLGSANYSKTQGKSYRDSLIAEIKNSGGEEILNSIKLSNFHGKGSYERYINALIEALANLRAEAAATEPEVQRLFEAPPSIQEAIQFYTDESEILDEVIVAEQRYKKVLDKTKDDNNSDAINKRKEALNNYKQALINTRASDKEFNQGLKEINNALKNNNGILDESITAHNLLSIAYADHENGLSSLRETLIQYGLDSGEVDVALDKLRIDINDAVEKARKFEQATREGEETTEDFTKRIQEASSAQYSWSQAIVQGAQTLSSLIMSLNSLKGAFDTLKNPDMSAWDKFTSIMTSLAFALPGIISGITTLKTVFEGLSAVGIAYNAIQGITIGALPLYKMGIAGLNKEKQKEIDLILQDNAVTILNTGLKKLAEKQAALNAAATDEEKDKIREEIKAIEDNTKAELKNMAVKKLKEKTGKNLDPKDAEDWAKNVWNEGEKKLNNSKGIDNLFSGIKAKFKKTTTEIKTGITDLAKKIGVEVPKMLGSFGLIALGVAAIGTAVYASIKLYNKDAEAAQKAANAAKIAGDAAQEAADKYNTLKDTIDKYNSIKDRMGELVAGTQAFKDAITEANAEALKLIQTLPGLQYTYDKNGLIQINSGDLEEAQSKAAVQANLSQSNSLIMQAQASEAQRKSANTNFQRDILKGTASDFWEDVGNVAMAAITGAGSGAAIGAGVGGLSGTAVLPIFGSLAGMAGGAASGALIGGIAGLATGIAGAIATGNSNKNEREGLDAVAAYYKKNPDLFAKFGVGTANYDEQGFADALKNIEGVTDDVAKVMAKNAEQLQEHIDTQSQLIEQERALLKEALNIRNMNNEDYSESDYKDFILAQQAKNIDSQSEQYQNKRTEIKNMLFGSEKDLAEEYLRYAFGDEADNYRIRNKGGTNWTIQKKNDSGSWETQGDKNSLSQEDVIDFVTKQKLLEESDKVLGNYLETAEKYGGQLERFGFSITEAQKASMTQSEIEEEEARMANIRDEILTAAAEERAADLTSLTFKEIRELREKSTAALDEYFKGTLDEALQAAEDAKRVANLNASASWNANSEQREKEDLQKTLEAVEMTEEAFDAYAESLQKVNSKSGMTVEMSRQIAKETIKTSAAIRDISTILDDNAKVFEELTSNQDDYVNGNKQLTAEQASVIGELKKALSDWLDTDFSFDEILQNMDKIKAAAENDAEAIRQLGYLAAQKTVMELNIDEASKNEFYNFISYIDGLDQNLTIGATLDMIGKEDFINDINEMILTGQVAAEDIAKAMKQIGIELQPKDFENVPAGETHTEANGYVSVLGVPIPYSMKYDTVNYAKVPIYDKNSFKYTGGGQTTTLPALKNSKGKSGGSKKDTTPKKVSEEIDRYHEVNAEIDDLTKKMDELSTLKDRAWGGRRIAAIRAEQQALKEYGELLQRKSNEAYEYLQQDASYLNAYGAIYDEEGRLLNSNEIIAQAVSDFNADRIDDEKFNNIKKYISNYESSLEEYQNSLYDIAENLRNQFDKEIEEITATVEVKLEVDDRQIKYIKWLVSHLEDKAFSQAAIISTASQNYDNILNKWDTYTTGIHDILAKAGASEEDITNYLNGNVDAFLKLDNIDEVVDELEEYTDGLADTYDQLKDLKDLIEQQLSSVYDEWNDKIEYQMGLMEHYDSILSHYRNIIDILGLDFLGLSTKNLIDLSQTQINSSVSMIQTLKARWNAAQEELKTAQVNLQNATSEADQKFWTEEVEKLTQASNELEENFYSSWEDILNKISDLFDTTRERIFKDFEKSISDAFNSFDEMSSLLDQRKTIAAEYVPEYKKIYELNKLNRNLAKEIDKINDVSKTKKLRDLQDEINAKMREGVQLSEYDLEYMQKKYDLRLAEIALEDAQAVKTTVRLQRDSSGNYSYVYTANEEETNDKLQDYEDKLYALQDTTENYFNTLSESYFQIMQDWENALGGLDKNDKNYEQKVNKINAFYQKRMQYITSELNKGLKNNQQLYKDDQEYMNTYYTNQENRQRAFVLNFKDTLVGGILNGFNSIDEATNYITGQMDNALDQLSIAWTDYYNQTEEALQLNGMSFNDFGEKLEDIIFGENGINAKISSIAETTKEMAESSKEDYNKAASAVESFQQRVGPKLDELFQKTNAFTGALTTLQQKLLENYPDPNITVTQTTITQNVNRDMSYDEYKKEQPSQASTNTNIPNPSSNQTLGPNNNSSSFYYVYKDNKVHYIYRAHDSSAMGPFKPVGESPHKPAGGVKTGNVFLCQNCNHIYTDDSLSLNTLNQVQEKIEKYGYEDWTLQGFTTREIQSILESNWLNESWIINNLMKKHNKKSNESLNIGPISGMSPQKYDTGGYTGDWGADGRLAMLHEKELVLNKQDTENMLSAVNVIRNLSSTLNLPDLANKMNYLPNQISSSYFRDLSKNQEITQEVHIDASFPGVTAREEIEQAFGELALQAAQYINRYDQ